MQGDHISARFSGAHTTSLLIYRGQRDHESQSLSNLNFVVEHDHIHHSHGFRHHPNPTAKNTMLLYSKTRTYLFVAVAIIIFWLLVTCWPFSPVISWTSGFFRIKQSATSHNQSDLHNPPLPSAYVQTAPKLTDCAAHDGPLFLQSASKTLVNYCNNASSSSLNCFRTHPSAKRTDSFCIGTPAVFDGKEARFKLGCALNDLTEEQMTAGVPELAQFPSYWYETGPGLILDRHVALDPVETVRSDTIGLPKDYTILVRREAPIDNLFHHLMQIFSVFLTLDILQMVLDPVTGNPFFRAESIKNTRVVIFDDHKEGPFYDQWTAFAKRPMERIKNLPSGLAAENIIIPLAGIANPFWQSDWEPKACEEPGLLQVFSQRILDFYDVHDELGPPDRPLVLTFIDRTEKRSLINKEDCINDLRSSYPNVEINLVNFALLSFAEQLRVIRETDILAGIHGAGLTHGIFLQPSSAMVEIMPFDFNHKGFRNLAKSLRLGYFTTHAIENTNKMNKGWQYDDVVIEQDRFKDLIGTAIKSMYHRGLLNDDVN